MIRRGLCVVLVTIFLSGCMSMLRPPRDEWPEIGHEFAKSLRWVGTDLAATFFTDSARTDFLLAYGNDSGLQVTNVRHDPVGPVVDNNVQGVLAIEYYRSPSVSIKNVRIPLQWSCIEAGSYLPCRWQITTLMTRLP